MVASLAAAAGVAVLRFAWARPRRSVALNATGWALFAAAAAIAWAMAGAWGVAVAALPAMAVAQVFLLSAAWTAPPGKSRASNRRVQMLPQAGEPRAIGRGMATFAFVGLAAPAVAVMSAVALRQAAMAAGLRQADANAIALFAQPLAWAILATAMLLTASRRRQTLILLATAVPFVPAFIMGSAT